MALKKKPKRNLSWFLFILGIVGILYNSSIGFITTQSLNFISLALIIIGYVLKE